LKGVDLEIRQGEIASIVGPSGCGKSTLLHILGTLDKPDKGEIVVENQRINFLNEKQMAAFRNRHVGFVFQFHHLLPEFTALENVCIPGWMAGRRKKEVEENASSLLQMLGLGHRIDNKPNALSGGEQQRVAVARALINKPAIIFADEPTGNLDSANARELHQLFFTLRQQFNQTFLIVTHNEELAQMSDRILHMKDGKIV
jgi:lipoprotein-releasing system ATP-binding protein